MGQEIWRQVVGFEGLYEVSNMGAVRSIFYRKNRGPFLMKFYRHSNYYGDDDNRYRIVTLWKDKKKYKIFVHVLVATAFIPNPDGKKEVDHINGIRYDNRVENLRWVTRSENRQNPISKKRMSESHKGRYGAQTSHYHGVVQLTMDGEFIKAWESISTAVRMLGVRQSGVTACCIGRYGSSGGYKWKYIEDYNHSGTELAEEKDD